MLTPRSRLRPATPRRPSPRLVRVRADDPHDHRHVALLPPARLDEPVRDLVPAGDAAEDVDEDRGDVRIGEDQTHRRGDLVGPGAAADIEEVCGLAAGALDEVHRRHRQPCAVDHAADRAVELDEADSLGTRRDVRRVFLVEVSQRLELGMAGQRAVVERHLRVQADEPLGSIPLPDDRQRVDLDEVGVGREHRPNQALCDPDAGLEVVAQPKREDEPPGLPVEQAELRVGVDGHDRVRALRRDLLDLDAALRRAHDQDPASRPVEDRRQVELGDDLGGLGDEDLSNGDSLDRHAQDVIGDRLGLIGRPREANATCLAAPADQDLRLHHDALAARLEDALRRSPGLGRGSGNLPGRDRQPVCEQQRLGVRFLDLHARRLLR
jgi:hypothetical protein